MMKSISLGIDFGSTSSCFSSYNSATGIVEACKSTENMEIIPSEACLSRRGKLLTGCAAKNARQDASRHFSAFKMLLAESNPTILKERGYDEKYTPELIARHYLHDHIRTILNDSEKDQISKIVICVPEVWASGRVIRKGLLDARKILRDICADILHEYGVKTPDIQVVSEPAAASAYFAHNYRLQNHGKPYSGHIVIIDYGGGTLDVAITEVTTRDTSTEIKVRFDDGFGENKENEIGKGGIAYIERVVSLALQDNPTLKKQPIDVNSAAFRRSVNSFEDMLKQQVSIPSAHEDVTDEELEDQEKLFFKATLYRDNITQLKWDNDVFTDFAYGDTDVDVTYSHLYTAFEDVVVPNLKSCLDNITKKLEEMSVDYRNPRAEDLSIVLVGGFSKFLLVQLFVQRYFGASSAVDTRFQNRLGREREYAVSKGAALLAANAISLRNTAPYGIGFSLKRHDSSIVNRMAFSCRELIEPGKICWIEQNLVNPELSVQEILIGIDEENHRGLLLLLKQTMTDKISHAYQKLVQRYALACPTASHEAFSQRIGFSMDSSEIVTMYLKICNTELCEPIELGRYSSMFELSEAKEVIIDESASSGKKPCLL